MPELRHYVVLSKKLALSPLECVVLPALVSNFAKQAETTEQEILDCAIQMPEMRDLMRRCLNETREKWEPRAYNLLAEEHPELFTKIKENPDG